jgi:hypothetical protein
MTKNLPRKAPIFPLALLLILGGFAVAQVGGGTGKRSSRPTITLVVSYPVPP